MKNAANLIKKVCLTGANGFIGSQLLSELLKQGYNVKILTRNKDKVFPKNVEVIIGDLTRFDCPLDKFLAEADVIINCAGEINDENQMRQLHVDATKSLIKAANQEMKRSGKKIHWVQLSSCGAYGPPKVAHLERLITENSPTNPKNLYEITKTIADELIIEADQNGIITYAILRPSNVFGINMKDQSLIKLIKLIKGGTFFYLGKPGTITTYVHVDDVVKALITLAEDTRATGQIFNLSSDCTLEALVSRIAYLYKIDKPTLRIPASLIRLPLAIIAILLKNLIHVPKLDALVLKTTYPDDKIKNLLGFNFFKPMPDSIEDLIKN